MLQMMDLLWVEHLEVMSYTRSSVNLRAYGQRDPLIEYKTEGFTLFENRLDRLRGDVTSQLSHINLMTEEEQRALIAQFQAQQAAQANKTVAAAGAVTAAATGEVDAQGDTATEEVPLAWAKTGRNAPCPCGSGLKYKHCHGALT